MKIKTAKLLLLLLLGMIAILPGLSIAADSYYISGMVANASTGSAIPTPQVLVGYGLKTWSAFTRLDGTYNSPNLGRPGIYTVIASAPDYSSSVATLNIINTGAITRVTKNFSLVPFSAGPRYTISTPVTNGGTVFCSNSQVPFGATSVCTVSADIANGYKISTVSGTCGGTLYGALFNTNVITSDCTVIGSFVMGP